MAMMIKVFILLVSEWQPRWLGIEPATP